MQNEDQSGTPGAEELDQARAEACMDRAVGDPTNVVSFSSPEDPRNHGSDDLWLFDDVDVASSLDDCGTTTEAAITLIVPASKDLGAGSRSSGQCPEWRISLYWRDAHQCDPEGLVLTDAEGQVLDLAMFRTLRDQLGAWISCSGQEREVLAALRFATQEGTESGIGAPAP